MQEWDYTNNVDKILILIHIFHYFGSDLLCLYVEDIMVIIRNWDSIYDQWEPITICQSYTPNPLPSFSSLCSTLRVPLIQFHMALLNICLFTVMPASPKLGASSPERLMSWDEWTGSDLSAVHWWGNEDASLWFD